MSDSTGSCPRLSVDTTSSGAVGQAGGVLLNETIAAAGLGSGMSAALPGWRKPLAVHHPAKVVMDLAVTLALGGDCLSDVALLRAEPGLYRRVASEPASRTIAALAADARQCWKRSTPPERQHRLRCGSWPASMPRTKPRTLQTSMLMGETPGASCWQIARELMRSGPREARSSDPILDGPSSTERLVESL